MSAAGWSLLSAVRHRFSSGMPNPARADRSRAAETGVAGIEHQTIVGKLYTELHQIAPQDLRVLPGCNVLRRSETDRLLIPDIAVVDEKAARRAADSDAAALRPEDLYLVVDVISRSSRETDLHLERQLYAQWKIGSYWVVDPQSREIHEIGLRVGADTWLADVDVSSSWPDRSSAVITSHARTVAAGRACCRSGRNQRIALEHLFGQWVG